LSICNAVKKPFLVKEKAYELDEIRTYVQQKDNFVWIAYCIRQDTKEVVSFNIGRRSKAMLKSITDLIIFAELKK